MTARSTPPPVATRPWIALGAVAAVLATLAFVFGRSEGIRPETPPPPLQPITDLASIDHLATPLGWTELDPGPLASRLGHAAVWTSDGLIIWGGRALDRAFAGGARFSQRLWDYVRAAPIAGGADHATAWTGKRLFAFTDAAAMYDPATDQWQPIDSPGVGSSKPLGAVATETEVLLIARELQPGALFAVAYGRGGECCRPLPPPPVDVAYADVFWTGDVVLLIGGSSDALALASYDPRTDAWRTHEAPPLASAGRITSSWNGRSLVVVDFELQSARWSPIDGWQALPELPFVPAGCIARTAAVGEEVFVWYCRQAALLDPATSEWQRVGTPLLDDHAVSTSCDPVGADDRVLMWCGNGDGGDPFLWEIDLTTAVGPTPPPPP